MQRNIFVAIGLAVFVCAASVGFADVMDAARCKEAKAKATGKTAFDLLKAFGKNGKKLNPVKLAFDISKADSKFTKGFSKAESRGGCLTSDDSPQIVAKVDALVLDIVNRLERPPGECDCCSGGFDLLSFETGIAVGQPPAGTLRNYRCSNYLSGACVDESDCDFGTCIDPPGFCSLNFGETCSGPGTPCTGTCGESICCNLPLDLYWGSVYVGGGLNSMPLPVPAPDKGEFFFRVTSCDGETGQMTLGATTPAEVGTRHCTQGRQCSSDGSPCVMDTDCTTGTCDDLCLIGAPIPLPNPGTPVTSVCVVNVIGGDATGTVQCSGDGMDLNLEVRAVAYLNGDLFNSALPPDVPGTQPCPLCDYLCQGGSKDRFPCDDDSECPGGSCGTQTECLGGPNNGDPCTPGTSDSEALGDSENSFPTSHDCGLDPGQDVTAFIGGVPVSFSLSSGADEWNAVDRPEGARVFCGYCRDVLGAGGSLCFEGDTSGGCPPAIPPADGNAVPCTSDADCTTDADQYESCVQRNPGAFSEAASTRLSIAGMTDGQCLADGQPHPANLGSLFCMASTFDATVDASLDLPGPGAVLLTGEVLLQ